MTLERPPICVYCRHLVRPINWDKPRCEAFPGGIPQAIIENERDHREPYQGDDGVRFDADSDTGRDYARDMFSAED